MTPLTDDTLEEMHVLLIRKHAEDLRVEAVALARRYAQLVERHRLDSEVVGLDKAAVVRAWQAVA